MSSERPGACNEPGPWGTICTEWLWHNYSHYDASDDSSWQDDWRENTSVEGGGTLED